MNNTVHDTKPQVRWPQDRRAKDNVREVAQPGGLAFADAVFDPGVLAVPQFQPGGLPGDDAAGRVGEERGDPVPVGVGEGELGAGVRAFLAQDQPRAFRPGRQAGHPGGLGDPGAVAQFAVVFDRRVPALGGDQVHDVLDALIDREPE